MPTLMDEAEIFYAKLDGRSRDLPKPIQMDATDIFKRYIT